MTNKKDNNDFANRFTWGLFIIYFCVLLWILIFKLGVRFSYMESRSVNLIPFNGALFSNGKIDFSEMILNILIFVPLGTYTGLLFERWNSGRKYFFFFLISLMLEGFQFIFKIGAFDITDIITNTIGGIIGLKTIHAIEVVCKSSVKAQKLINIIAAIGTAFMIMLLLLLKLDMLPIKYR